MAALGLPSTVKACLFDLDGVLTQTATVHAAAWKRTFDDFLRQRAQRQHERFVPFDEVADYERYVDGKPRYDGVASFLSSRGIQLDDGAEDDTPDTDSIHGLGNRKHAMVLEMLERDGVDPYPGSVEYVRAVRAAGMRMAVVSSSTDTRTVLRAAHIDDLFEHIVDGVVAASEHLRGKPAPDTYLAGARAVGVAPSEAAVFEDALAGVQAGRAGHFGVVVGVDRLGQADALRAHGADIVVSDLGELLSAR